MANRKHSAVRTAVESLLVASLVFGGYKLYHRWRDFDAAEQRALGDEKQWVYGRVQSSAVGSPSFMAAAAQEFTGKTDVYIGSCDWYATPMWRHSIKNPNWLSASKGSTGMQVIGNCEIKGSADYVPEMQFEWEWEDGRGVIGVSWGWAPDEP